MYCYSQHRWNRRNVDQNQPIDGRTACSVKCYLNEKCTANQTKDVDTGDGPKPTCFPINCAQPKITGDGTRNQNDAVYDCLTKTVAPTSPLIIVLETLAAILGIGFLIALYFKFLKKDNADYEGGEIELDKHESLVHYNGNVTMDL